jgi:hypothetical protein
MRSRPPRCDITAGRAWSAGSSRSAGAPESRPFQLRVQRLAPQLVALPRGKVGVLHGQIGQRRRLTAHAGGVERRDLAHQHAHGPAVGDDVVQCHQQRPFVVRHAQQRRAQQRPGRQVERARTLVPRPARRLRAGVGGAAQVFLRQRDRVPRVDYLGRNAAHAGKARSQRLMPAHHLAQAPAQGIHVQAAPQPQRKGHVVGGGAGLQLVQ